MPKANEQALLQHLMSVDSDVRNNILINNAVKDTVGQILNNVNDDNIQLKATNVRVVEKYDNKNIAMQKDVRNKGQIWGNDVRADFDLIDKKTGTIIDSVENMKVADVPKVTDRGTFLVGGNEYQFTRQARLKPGVYTKRQKNGEISSFFNVDKTVDFERGFNNNFKIEFDPEKKIFTMGYGTKHIPLINALRTVGVSEGELKGAWGKEVYEANSKAYDKQVGVNQNKFYEAVFNKAPTKELNTNDVAQQIKDRLFATELDPEVTEITLGRPYKNVNKNAILDASEKIININKGTDTSDDREALIFKSFYDIEDHIREKLIKGADKIVNNIKWKLGKTKSINKSMSTQSFNPFIVGTITNSILSSPPSQVNPMAIIGESSKMTVMGEGGIGSANAVTNETRAISNSEMGFIDPLHTPEGSNIGVAVHTSVDTIKVGNDLYSKFIKPNGDIVLLRPIDVHKKNIGFPDQFKLEKGKVRPLNDKIKIVRAGLLGEADKSKVDYYVYSPQGMFDTSANSIPFLDSIQGNRGLTASKMQEQALSLKHRERPLYNIISDGGKSFGEVFAGVMALPKAPVDGKVMKVGDNHIIIKDKDKKDHEIQLYNNFSLNTESFFHNEPKVSVGDDVKKDALLADNNFTKDGHLALGTNLHVAYMPFKGYNYEDSAIISETAAKKLTSLHMYDMKTKRTSSGVFSKNKYKAYYPEELTAANEKKLDKDGVILPGETVSRGDVVIAHLEKKSPSADDIMLGRLDKQLKRDMSDNGIKWENDHVGVVTDVKKSGNSVVVNIKTEEPLKVADKISGLHGNKHIVSKIVPDDQMPFNPTTGKHIDLTMSPIGVSNRINTSQLLENAAGKIATMTGKPYDIKNFTLGDNSRRVLADMKVAGVSDKDILLDPDTGKPYQNPIANGFSHILKLEHKVDHKYSARYREDYDSNEQPASGGETGGKNLGRMEFSALLARGAKENLKEMFSIKGQRNDEYWKAMETGQSLPPPKDAFVWDKQLAMMNGAGINVQQKGKNFILKPLTDKDILEKSRGEILKPTDTYRLKDMAPMKEGLFDPVKAGGIFGDHFTHFSLPEKVLNPITASAVATLVGMPTTKLEDIVTGKIFVDKTTNKIVAAGSPNAVSGGLAVESLLKAINITEDLKQASEALKLAKNPTEINKLNKKIKYLRALNKNDMKPEDYLISKVLVTPSKFRPVMTMAGGDGAVIMSDINDLYQQVAHTGNALKSLKGQLDSVLPDEDIKNIQLAPVRGQLYQDLKAVVGLQEPTSYLNRIKNKKGYIMQISGGDKQAKEGFFQDKALERRQDLVGRSTIILNPDLGGDQIGIPKIMASEIFAPFIMKKLNEWGYSPLEAQKEVSGDTKVFQRAREVVAGERIVIANRAPTLHRYNMTAFKPVLTEGKSIEVPGVPMSKNFGADFDGDSQLSSIYISIKINELRKEIEKGKKIWFSDDLCIDSNNNLEYIDTYLKPRGVSMPGLDKLVMKNRDDVYHIHISEFPRLEETKNVKENGNEDYDVPQGISIFTLDNSTHEFVEVPVTKFSIHKNLSNYTVETSSGDCMWLSSDQSAIALNRSTFELERVTPEKLKGECIPKVRNMNVKESIFSIPLIDFSKSNGCCGNKKIDCKKEMPLSETNGWLLGAMIGDGWVSVTNGNNQLCMANISKKISSDFDSAINGLMSTPIPMNSISNTHDFEGFECHSEKHTKSSSALAKNFIPWIGQGAYNKHLPPFYLSAPVEFRMGLLAGLLDTDGTVCWLAKKGGKRQFNMQYSTASDRLAEEMVTLCRSLDMTASIAFGNKIAEGVEKRVVISTTTAHGKNINIRHEVKRAAFDEFCSIPKIDSPVSARQDLVPFTPDLFVISKEFVHHIKDIDVYRNINDSKRTGWMLSRQSAKRLIALDKDNKLPQRWKDIISNENVTWVYVKDMKLNPTRITMYDITAPGPYTFMLANGIIVQDTFQIHVPISAKAQAEAEKMKPSENMLKTGYDSVLNMPDMDMLVGSWLVSKGRGGKDTGIKFDSIDAAREAFKQHKVSYADSVIIGGKKAPLGVHEINSAIPENSRRYDIELDKKNVENWIRDVTKTHNGKLALGLANKIKDVGNNYATEFGFTLGISDTLTDNELRNKLIAEAETKVKKGDQLSVVSAYANAVEAGRKSLSAKHGEETMLGIGIKSGGSKGIENTSAITFMPGIVTDAEDRAIPMPITNSYSEGLDTFGYWTAAHGARGGNIKKSVSSFMPGWLTKDLVNSIYDTTIQDDKPVDTKGMEYSINDKKGIANRFLAKDIKDSGGTIVAKRNDIVSSDVINKAVQRGINSIFVQSPLTDPTPGDGFSSYSYGVDNDGKKPNIGDNIGIQSAHTITEPSLNLAMKSFHTGGALQIGKKSLGTMFDKLDRVLRFTKNLPDKATVSSMDGVVKDIKKSSIGGHDIYLSNGSVDDVRYVDPNNDINVEKGSRVGKGDALSSGTVSPHDMLKYKGMPETQRFLVGEISNLMEGKLDKRNIETLVRGVTNTTRVMDSGSHRDYIKGDVAPLTTIEYYNDNNRKEEDVGNTLGDHLAKDYGSFKKDTKIDHSVLSKISNLGIKRLEVFKDRIKHEPFLTPTGIGAKAQSSENWIARLAHSKIKKVLEEGTTQGWRSDISESSHPIPQYVTGEYTW